MYARSYKLFLVWIYFSVKGMDKVKCDICKFVHCSLCLTFMRACLNRGDARGQNWCHIFLEMELFSGLAHELVVKLR